MTIHPYNATSHGKTVSDWWAKHTGRVLQTNMLPPVGLVGEDDEGLACACWLHLSVGVGVCFVENPVSRPGLSLSQAREYFLKLLAALEVVALTHDYGVMCCNTPPAIARILKGAGFEFTEQRKMTGLKLLR